MCSCSFFTSIEKRFRNLHVLTAVSATLASGSITAIIGPNGSGKTTLLQQREIAAIQGAKGWAFVINEDNVDSVEELLTLERTRCDKP